jgi:hypothetical protein
LIRKGASCYPLTITNNYNYVKARVSIEGQLVENFERLIPEVMIFKETIGKNFMLYSGYDDGCCCICGRRLIDPVSVKYGRGLIGR